MPTTSNICAMHDQEHPRRPWRTQGPRPSARGREGRRASTYRPRTSGPQARTSGAPDIRALAGNPAPLSRRHPWLNPSSPDIRPLGPDIRRLGKARTSGPRPDIRPLPARRDGPEAHVSLSHLPLRGPRLYILLPLLHLRVSLEIAHLILSSGSSPCE